MSVTSIMIVGVGGQGTLLASKLLGNAMLTKGFDVKVSEVHGMSQRGGSVVTYVRFGDRVDSPIIEKGEADVIISFEQLEAARWLPFLKKNGRLVVNTQTIDPMPVITGNAVYPSGIVQAMEQAGISVTAIDALSIAEQVGSSKAVNVVLIGVTAQFLDVDKEHWMETIRQTVPARFVDLNLRAFEAGMAAKS